MEDKIIKQSSIPKYGIFNKELFQLKDKEIKNMKVNMKNQDYYMINLVETFEQKDMKD